MLTIINDSYFHKKGFYISNDKSLINIDLVYTYLTGQSYWAKGMLMHTFNASVQNSICFGVYDPNGQAGFARVISDKATFAYICDVFILPDFRKEGLSKWLIQTILAHPELNGLRRWSLATLDAHGLYTQFGFKRLNYPERWMEMFTPYIA